MPTIDAYAFGHMTIDGKPHTKDVIIYPDGTILCPWWRGSGHRLEYADITTLVAMKPDIIIAGTGAHGLMAPSKELLNFLREKGIEFLALPTGEAINVYNDRSGTVRTGGCFHLTC